MSDAGRDLRNRRIVRATRTDTCTRSWRSVVFQVGQSRPRGRRGPEGVLDVRVALVGTGAIGSFLLDGIASGAAGPIEIVALADVPARAPDLARMAERIGCSWHTDGAQVLRDRPDLVVEAASPQVVRAFAGAWLEGGADVLVMSVGALADPALLADLSRIAVASRRSRLRSVGRSGRPRRPARRPNRRPGFRRADHDEAAPRPARRAVPGLAWDRRRQDPRNEPSSSRVRPARRSWAFRRISTSWRR